ncbi:MAG: alpha/beta fold hydrolase [Acidobacteria bacterium]|nr:alpha/beta fold hydrolase [Acidobacteriota bacterium]
MKRLLACLLWLCLAPTADAIEGRRAGLRPCHVEGLAEEVLCGSVDVPERRTGPAGTRIRLAVAVLPATTRARADDPVFLLAGGPGQGARLLAGPAARAFRALRRSRDLVLVDVRGTGGSGALSFSPGADELGDLLGGGVGNADRLAAERDRLLADPAPYDTEAIVADLEDVRSALGCRRVNLWGGSYGTRVAQLWARRHPDAIRSVVLDGAAPLAMPLPLFMARDAETALDGLLTRCERDAACAAKHASFRRDLASVLARFSNGPISVALRDPRNGVPRPALLTRTGFVAGLRAALYVPRHAALVPLVVAAAARDDYGPLAALLSEGAAWSVETMALGMTLSVLCTEDVPRLDPPRIARETAGTFVGTAMAEAWREACEVWPRGAPPRGFDEHVVVPVPALILSGGRDPVTPPIRGDEMAGSFSPATHVVVPEAGHGSSFLGCVPRLIAGFIERGTGEGLDAACVKSIPAVPVALGPEGGRL